MKEIKLKVPKRIQDAFVREQGVKLTLEFMTVLYARTHREAWDSLFKKFPELLKEGAQYKFESDLGILTLLNPINEMKA